MENTALYLYKTDYPNGLQDEKLRNDVQSINLSSYDIASPPDNGQVSFFSEQDLLFIIANAKGKKQLESLSFLSQPFTAKVVKALYDLINDDDCAINELSCVACSIHDKWAHYFAKLLLKKQDLKINLAANFIGSKGRACFYNQGISIQTRGSLMGQNKQVNLFNNIDLEKKGMAKQKVLEDLSQNKVEHLNLNYPRYSNYINKEDWNILWTSLKNASSLKTISLMSQSLNDVQIIQLCTALIIRGKPLDRLNLNNNKLTFKAIQSLINLPFSADLNLDVSDNCISYNEALLTLPFKTVNMMGNHVTFSQLEKIQKGASNLYILSSAKMCKKAFQTMRNSMDTFDRLTRKNNKDKSTHKTTCSRLFNWACRGVYWVLKPFSPSFIKQNLEKLGVSSCQANCIAVTIPVAAATFVGYSTYNVLLNDNDVSLDNASLLNTPSQAVI